MAITPHKAVRRIWPTFRQIVTDFIRDGAFNRGAAIAFYATIALVPLLFMIVSVAGSVFGPDAARGALKADVEKLVGSQAASFLQLTIKNAAYTSGGLIENVLSVVILVLVVTGLFSEMRSALNTVFRAEAKRVTVTHHLWTLAGTIILVAVLAVLLLTSMVATTLITAIGRQLSGYVTFGAVLLTITNLLVTWVLTALLFAAVYRILPDKDLTWHDVTMGGAITALLFQLGQFGIGVYLGSGASTASVYGAVGSLMALLLWIFYSAEIFLFGAEVTRVYTEHRRNMSSGSNGR